MRNRVTMPLNHDSCVDNCSSSRYLTGAVFAAGEWLRRPRLSTDAVQQLRRSAAEADWRRRDICAGQYNLAISLMLAMCLCNQSHAYTVTVNLRASEDFKQECIAASG
jgi:hypothetical protein